MTRSPRKILEEMKRVVDEVREVDFYRWQSEQRAWEEEQRLKAPRILEALRQHLPSDVLQDIEQFLSNGYGCDCLRDALQRCR